MFCPNCGMENADHAVECRRCHVPLQEEAHGEAHAEAPAQAAHGESNAAGTICSRCETFNEAGIERCTTCGYPLASGAALAAEASPAGHHEEIFDAPPELLEVAEEPHEEAHAEEHRAAPAPHHDDDAGSTHMLTPLDPVLTHDTPAEGNPSIADELSALELSPEDARAARGEDATPPDGSPPVAQHPITEEHKLELPHENGDEEEERTSVSAEPEFTAPPVSGRAPSSPGRAPALSIPPRPPPPLSAARAPSSPGLGARRTPSSTPYSLPPLSAQMAPPVPTAPPAAAAAEKICASCGSVNLPNAKFCAECGTPFMKKPASPVSAPPPVEPVLAAHEEPEANVALAGHEELHEEQAHEEHHQEAAPVELYEEPAPEHHEAEHNEEAAPVELHQEHEAELHEGPVHEDAHAAPEEEHAGHQQEAVGSSLHDAMHSALDQGQQDEETAPGQTHDLPDALSDQFDPHKTDPSQMTNSDEEHTSEQPRVMIAEDAHEPADGPSSVQIADEYPLAEHAEHVEPIEQVEEIEHAEAPSIEVAAEEEPVAEEAPAEVEAELAAEASAEAGPEPLPTDAIPATSEEAPVEVAAEAPPYTVLLVVEKGEHAGTTFHLAAIENSIGGAGATIELDQDVHLAPHQATVLFEEQRLLLRDEGTANGVYLKLRAESPLEAGDQFIAGERLLRFDGPVELASSDDALPVQGAPRPAGHAVRVVELLAGGKQGRTCYRGGPVIAVGKTGCDLNFGSDQALAPRHAEIHLAEDGTASLVDLGAVPDGVLLRVRQGQTVELQPGDVLQMGGQTLRIELE